MELLHAQLDVLGVDGRANRCARASRKRRLRSPGAGLGGVLGRMTRGPRGSASEPELTLEVARLLFACADLRLRRFRPCSRFRRLGGCGLLRLRHIDLGWARPRNGWDLSARLPSHCLSQSLGGLAQNNLAPITRVAVASSTCLRTLGLLPPTAPRAMPRGWR